MNTFRMNTWAVFSSFALPACPEGKREDAAGAEFHTPSATSVAWATQPLLSWSVGECIIIATGLNEPGATHS
jgi:hypothetical protein